MNDMRLKIVSQKTQLQSNL